MTPDWFPDWRGKACAIIASGPSVKKLNLASLKGRLPVLAIKENVTLAPWADVVYGCDAAWWKFRNGLQDFKGLKVTWRGDNDHPPAKFPDLHYVDLDATQNRFALPQRRYEMIFDAPGIIGSGANSAYQALNLVVQFGAERVLLLGVDNRGDHWYGRNTWRGANNPSELIFPIWERAFAAAAKQLQARGVEVVNGSPPSALTCFPKQTIEQTLANWRL